MKRLITFTAAALITGLAFAQAAATNPFTQDFTKGLGKWEAMKCTSTQDADGLKITKTEEYGGIAIEEFRETYDLSAYKSIDFVMENKSDKPIEFSYKIKSGKATPPNTPEAHTMDQAATLQPGEHTVSFPLNVGSINTKEVNYIKIWTAANADLKLTIKKASFTNK